MGIHYRCPWREPSNPTRRAPSWCDVEGNSSLHRDSTGNRFSHSTSQGIPKACRKLGGLTQYPHAAFATSWRPARQMIGLQSLQSGRIGPLSWVIPDVSIEVRTATELERIFTDELRLLRVIPPCAIVHKTGVRIRLAPRVAVPRQS